MPGDHVVCCNAQGLITVNGVPLHEQSYLYPGDQSSSHPSGIPGHFNVTVPQGYLWVLGDHRSISDDSRGHEADPGNGMVPENEVIGRAFVIVWPPSQWRILPIPSTFEQPGITKSASAAAAAGPGAAQRPSAAARVRPAAPYLPVAAGFGRRTAYLATPPGLDPAPDAPAGRTGSQPVAGGSRDRRDRTTVGSRRRRPAKTRC